MLGRVVRVVVGLALAFAVAQDARAQITAATISGTVKDETGGILPGASITVRNQDTGVARSSVTDDQGRFAVPGLQPGKYELSASLEGFATTVQNDIPLAVGQQASLNVTLKVSAAAETITVAGVSAIVDTQNAALSAVVTNETIEQLPLNGRNYIDLALLQPGVTSFYEKSSTTSSNRGTKMNINGMGYRSNSYLIDGANMRGFAGTATVSAAETTLGVETIQEFRVVTNAYGADYGRAMGGVISLVTKGGTNNLHGSIFEFFRNNNMDARNFFDKADPPPFTRNQFGGTAGGPIVKNKLFFFGGYERLQEDLGTTNISFVPTMGARQGALGTVNPVVKPYLDLYPEPNGVQLSPFIAEYRYEFNNPTRENFYQGRVDYAMTENDSFFGRYTYDGADQRVPLGFPEYGTDSISRNQFFTTEYKRILSSTILNTARFSHSRLRFEQLPFAPSLPNLAFVRGQDQIGVVTVTGLTTLGGGTTNPSTNNAFYWTFSDDFTWTKGRHLLKLGGLVEHVRTNKLTATSVRGGYTFNSVALLLAGTSARYVGVPEGAQLERVRPNTLFGIYAQDDFRLSDKLTLNLGLRYEFFTLPKEKYGLDTALVDIYNDRDFTEGALFAKNPSLKNLAPRVGFAWDLTGDGRTAIRGGAGMYHDTDGTYNSAFGVAAFSPPFAATTTINNPTFPVPPTGGTVARTARTLDYNIEQPYAVTYNVNVQRELLGNIVATVGYAGSHGYNLVSAIEGNPNVPQIQADGTYFFPAAAVRRNPAWGNIDFRTSGGRSVYNALQLSAQKRFSNNYQVQVTYTLGKTMDNTQAQLGADANNSSVYPTNPYDREADWARADFDVRHVFTTNFVWNLPGGERLLLGGWQLNGILTMRSGVGFTPTLGSTSGTWTRSGNNSGEDRPNLKAGVNPKDLILGNADHYFDPAGFELQPQGYLGNAGRNILSGPGFMMTNLSLVKNAKAGWLGSGGGLQLRIEMFNVLNHANFATPDRVVFAAAAANETPLATAGRLTRTVTSARQMQLGIKLLF